MNYIFNCLILTIHFSDKNTPPKANAGGDKTIVLPVSAIILNGSLSWDDLAIVKWDWIREPNSLAAGNIILNSDHLPVLIVCILYSPNILNLIKTFYELF